MVYMWQLKLYKVCSSLVTTRLFATAATPSMNVTNDSNNKYPEKPGFQHAQSGIFVQNEPVFQNPYITDSLLQSYLRRFIPSEEFNEISKDLDRFGCRIQDEIEALSRQCEQNPPTLISYDAWGNRSDEVVTCSAWKHMKSIAAEEGIISIGYKRDFGPSSRLYQMAKLLLFCPSSGLYSCPLAMADGAAKVLETALADPDCDSDFLSEPFRRLTTRDSGEFWTSGQWMTEKGGGSDVATSTETLAYKQSDGSYKLKGYKWFTSATDADMSLALARVVDENGDIVPGSKGLSLFYLETRNAGSNQLNGLQITRLKDKLGTRQLPTGELILDGTIARMVGKEAQGIRNISGMLTVTRLHNSVSSVGGMRHLLQLSKDYATKRKVFGSHLSELPLHLQTMARLETETRAAFLLTFEIVRLLGITETSSEGCEEEKNLIRILTPICKLYTAKQAVKVTSEGLESFGGAGYLEDTGLPAHLRDAQVLSIWEGTTNVLSMDTLRAIGKSKGEALNSFFRAVNERLTHASGRRKKELRSATAKVQIAAGDLRAFISQTSTMDSDTMFLAARDFSYSLARTYMAALLLDHASWEGASPVDLHAANMWCSQDLCPAVTVLRNGGYSDKARALDKQLVFDSFTRDS